MGISPGRSGDVETTLKERKKALPRALKCRSRSVRSSQRSRLYSHIISRALMQCPPSVELVGTGLRAPCRCAARPLSPCDQAP